MDQGDQDQGEGTARRSPGRQHQGGGLGAHPGGGGRLSGALSSHASNTPTTTSDTLHRYYNFCIPSAGVVTIVKISLILDPGLYALLIQGFLLSVIQDILRSLYHSIPLPLL